MNRWLNRTANLFLLVLCSLSLLRLIQESFHLSVKANAYAWLTLLCVLLWAAVFFRRGFLPGMGAAAAVLWFLIRRSGEDLRPELMDLLRALRISWLNGFGNESGEAAFEALAETHTLALLLILFLAALYLTIVLSGESYRVNLSLLLTVPLAVLCLGVNRNVPALPLLGLGLFWTELIISGDSYRPRDAAGSAVLLTLLPCLAVLGVSLLFNSPSDYVPEDKARILSQRFEALSSTVSSLLDGRQRLPQIISGFGPHSDALSGWDQGQDTLDLTRPYDFSARAHEIFRFRSSADGALYLRGRSLGAYTGTGWSRAEAPADFQALNYAAYAAAAAGYTGSGSVMACSFEIEADQPYDTLYLPYFTLSDPSGESFVPADGKTACSGQYLLLTDGSFGPLPERLRQEELQYRSFVREYYTALPDSTREALAEIARQNGLNAGDPGILSEVVDYICQGSTYDLGVTPYPDSDYAVYFLLNARRGYCIHYATAACCLYRALGIPARLCEGFLITAYAGSETTVRAADAHAWVEVWLDGVGWLPVEATYGGSPAESDSGGSALQEGESAQYDDEDRASPPADPETAITGQHTQIAPDGSESGPAEAADEGGAGRREGASGPDHGSTKTDGPEGSVPDDAPQKPEDKTKAEPDSAAKEKNGTFRTAGIFLAVPAAAVLAALGRYVLVRKRRIRRLSEPDGRLRAVYLYREARRVLSFGGEMPEAVLTAAEKASFSPHSIGEEELHRSREALNALTEQVQQRLGPLRRLFFRYSLGL